MAIGSEYVYLHLQTNGYIILISLMQITRSKRQSDYGNVREIKISVVARNNTVIKQLVLEAKKRYERYAERYVKHRTHVDSRRYEKDAEHRIHVYIPETWGGWRWNGSRQKRPLDSVVLESNVKDMLVSDCKDFVSHSHPAGRMNADPGIDE